MATIGLVRREEWGAALPKATKKYSTVPSFVRIVQTNTTEPTSDEESKQLARSLQWNHMFTEGYVDLHYNFMVGFDGVVYEGRGWKTQPDNLPGLSERLDIAYMGCYTGIPPPKKYMSAVFNLLEYGVHNKLLNRSFNLSHLDPNTPVM